MKNLNYFTLLSLALPTLIFGANSTWNGNSSNILSNAANWSNGTPSTASDVGIFDGSETAPSLTSFLTVGSFNFTSGGYTFDIQGALSFIGEGITNNTGLTQTFNIVNNTSAVSFSGSKVNANNTTFNLANQSNIYFSSSSNTVFNGVITGNGNVTKTTSTSTLTFSKFNSYTGSTGIESGTLLLIDAADISSSTGVSLLSDSILDISQTTNGTEIKSLSGDPNTKVLLGDKTLTINYPTNSGSAM